MNSQKVVILTGVAGFIGFHLARFLLARGDRVIGIDNINDYYDVTLKEARLTQLHQSRAFTFYQRDLADSEAISSALKPHQDITHIVHLAAQAGVRHSLAAPARYVASNVQGHVTMLECARTMPALQNFVYASSSSVYGLNTNLPFRETDAVNRPSSVYAATKRADELISEAYAHLYGFPQTGLRFFTVYGPWGGRIWRITNLHRRFYQACRFGFMTLRGWRAISLLLMILFMALSRQWTIQARQARRASSI
ncbi:dTDP-glucose 4,6-dehydratase [Acetobacteraceae bacterium EV16P]|uniref:dTDP-glucose 4,6-dehydratase n=1 Tax=Sorlinia euscelidii TaxID=3081148 RepID=A0ABU7TZ15_9PROT